MTTYRAMVSPASSPGDFVAELDFTNLTITDGLNQASSCSLAIPTITGNAALGLDDTDSSALEPAKTLLWVERDGALVFGGIVWTSSADLRSGVITINAHGFHSYLRRRLIRSTQTFSAVDQWDIARQLVDYAEGETDSLGVITTPQTANSGVARDRTYPSWERKNIGEALEQLAAVNNGFDFRYDLVYSGGVPEAQLFCFDSTGYQTDLVVDLDSNAESLALMKDGASVTNQVDVFGQGEGPERLVQTSTQSSPGYPLLQSAIFHSDISRTSTLLAHAERTRATLQRPVTSVSVVMSPGDRTAVAARVGDLIGVRAAAGAVSVDSSFKVTGRTINVSGTETVSLFCAGSDSFSNI